MSDRFYTQMLESTGWCPGFRNTTTLEEYESIYGKVRRKRKMAWTDESKQEAIDMYTAEEPTPENSMEIVKDIAAELGESPNGVRMILMYMLRKLLRLGLPLMEVAAVVVYQLLMHNNQLKMRLQIWV